jgi:hypothetical protein
MIQFVSLKKGKQGAGVSERISKLVGEEPPGHAQSEMKKFVKELPADPGIVALFKISTRRVYYRKRRAG